MKFINIWFSVVFISISSSAFAENGIASIFCDRVTASGGMNCNGLVAAHKTLPLGSYHRVSYNGRSIVVKIIDRGPYIRGRIIDLSPGAAKALGINGLGQVIVN